MQGEPGGAGGRDTALAATVASKPLPRRTRARPAGLRSVGRCVHASVRRLLSHREAGYGTIERRTRSRSGHILEDSPSHALRLSCGPRKQSRPAGANPCPFYHGPCGTASLDGTSACSRLSCRPQDLNQTTAAVTNPIPNIKPACARSARAPQRSRRQTWSCVNDSQWSPRPKADASLQARPTFSALRDWGGR